MAKTQEELKQIKLEFETLTNKLKELSIDELKQVTGGAINSINYAEGAYNPGVILVTTDKEKDEQIIQD